MEIKDKLQKWNKILDSLTDEVTELKRSKDIYLSLADIVEENPKINYGNRFHGWIIRNYIHTMFLSLRRLIDKDSRTISFYNFLHDIESHTDLITRKWYLSLYKGYPNRLGNINFNSICGDKVNTLPVELVNEDMEVIENIRKKIKHFADKRLAHFDKIKKIKYTPTFDDLYESIDHLEGIVKKYHLLLRAHGIEDLTPIVQYKWKEIFKIPWINNR